MRVSLVEYDNGIYISEEIRPLINQANKTIQRALRLKRSALVVSDGKLRAFGVAGAIRLSKDIELEIVPKILDDFRESDWRESLFLLSALSKYGNIITSEQIHSSTAYKDSLYDIAGRIIAREYLSHRRKPIRQYHRDRFYDYSIEGEICFESVFEKNPDGISQEKVVFDKMNPYYATIQAAMKAVRPYVKEPSVRFSLDRAIQEIGLQTTVALKRLKIPSRNKEWEQIYNLAFDVVLGMGSSLASGEIMSPSFIVDTWRIWEWLITISLKVGLSGTLTVIPKAKIPWGWKQENGKRAQLAVFPDVAIYRPDDRTFPILLVDAKYKSVPERSFSEIDRADLYEAFAFCRASGANKLFLAYPNLSGADVEAGSISYLTNYAIEDISITAVKIALGAIPKQGGITSFCRKVSAGILEAIV